MFRGAYDWLVRRERELNNLSGVFPSSFKLPLADRFAGRFDEHWIPSHNLGGLNVPICSDHNFQLDHTANVHTLREFRIDGSNSVDYFSFRVALRLSRVGLREQTGKQCQRNE